MKVSIRLIVILATLLFLLPHSNSYGDANYVEGEILVWFYSQYCPISIQTDSTGNIVTGFSSIDSLLALYDCTSMEKSYKGNLPEACGLHLLTFPPGSDLAVITEDFAGDSHVSSASPNFLGDFDNTPNDPYFPGASGQVCHGVGSADTAYRMMSEKGWEINKGDSSIVIAVIDIGVDYDHPDLKANIWINPQEDSNGNGTYEPWYCYEQRDSVWGDWDEVDNDNNGYKDDVLGWDFEETSDPIGDNNPMPNYECPGGPEDEAEFPHGTRTASAAAAVTNNDTGVAGTCRNCKIMVLKIASPVWNGPNAIAYAIENGAKVISMSWGIPAGVVNESLLRKAVQIAYQRDVVLVASAGNEDTNLIKYPAGYPEVIGVAAADSNGVKRISSNYGPWVKVAAPEGTWMATTHYDAHPQYPDCLARNYYNGAARLRPK